MVGRASYHAYFLLITIHNSYRHRRIKNVKVKKRRKKKNKYKRSFVYATTHDGVSELNNI